MLATELWEAIKDTVVIQGVALTWCTSWLQFAIIPFFNRQEELYKDYMTTGEIELVCSKVLTNYTMPEVETIVKRALDSRPDKRKSKGLDFTALLDSIDIIDELRLIEESVSKYRKVEDGYNSLRKSCTPTVILGVVHILATLVFSLSGGMALQSGDLTTVPFITSMSFWLISLLLLIILVARYYYLKSALTKLLGDIRNDSP